MPPLARLVVLALLVLAPANAPAQPQRAPQPRVAPSKADLLRGEYGRYRANNDLLYYHLDIRVDPEKKTIAGKTTVRFKMLADDDRIQLDLHPALAVDKILLGEKELKYRREFGAVLIDFPEKMKTGREVSIDFHYSGNPEQKGRFGGFNFGKDPKGRPWVYTACELQGASVWWPNKDQWRDKVESMDISVIIPSGLVDVSNGKFVGKKDLGDGYTRWDWHVSYPINNYCVSLNVGNYEHFSDKMDDGLALDFYALPEDLEKAKKQFGQAKGTIEAFQHFVGEYPFKKDGYKLIQVPYSGMEHQSAVTYGNGFKNGYHGNDWTGVGISPRFDFIIVHESGHEWFGNSVSAADRSDMWIHEGWTTYIESLYVEFHWGKTDALRYLNGYKNKVANRQPVVARRGVNAIPTQDMYFKCALFLNTLRSVVDDDEKWWKLVRGFYRQFAGKQIMTEDVVAYFNKESGRNLTAVFDQYLRHAALPVLELKFDADAGEVAYRWKADEKGFNLPVRVGSPDKWQLITPTTEWQTLKTPLGKDKFQVATDLYYIAVSKQQVSKPQADAAGAVRKAAETAEVHAVGIYQPAINRISRQDLKDPPGFVASLRERKGPAGRVWELLPEDVRKLASADDIIRKLQAAEMKPNPDPAPEAMFLRARLSFELSKLLDRSDFYTEEAFKGVKLGNEVNELIVLGDKRSAHETARLNWGLLHAAFPSHVVEMPSRFRTVRIELLEGRDVILVLSSYAACRWEVKVRPGARVSGVVLTGYYAQEVAGVDAAPVVYRAYYNPDGKRRDPDTGKLFYGYDEKHQTWERFLEGIKEVTGKELDSAQTAEESKRDGEPYSIRPTRK